MSFKISSKRPAKVQKLLSAFEEGDAEQQEGDGTAGSSSQAADAALAVSARKWIDEGSCYADSGNAHAALRCWEQAALIQPRNSRLHEMRAQVLDQVGRTFEAVQAAQQAVSLEPNWVEGHITLARVQLNLGEPQLALNSYMAAAKLQPGHPDLAQEVPNAQMLAKMHQQQPRGSRAHVVESSSGVAVTGAADLGLDAAAAEAEAVAAAIDVDAGGVADVATSPAQQDRAAAADAGIEGVAEAQQVQEGCSLSGQPPTIV